MDYRGFWTYKEKDNMSRGGGEIEEGDIVYVISQSNNQLHVSFNRKIITIWSHDLIKYFNKENRRGHAPSACKQGGGCESCRIWKQRRNF